MNEEVEEEELDSVSKDRKKIKIRNWNLRHQKIIISKNYVYKKKEKSFDEKLLRKKMRTSIKNSSFFSHFFNLTILARGFDPFPHQLLHYSFPLFQLPIVLKFSQVKMLHSSLDGKFFIYFFNWHLNKI